MSGQGAVIVLNGPPRSGKSSVAAEIVATFPGEWVNVGVDSMMATLSEDLHPGLGLRPGGERPDLEPVVREQYHKLFTLVVDHARTGVNVVVDVGVHDDYSTPLGIAEQMASAFADLEVLLVGVRCSLEVVRVRRAETGYLTWPAGGEVPAPIQRWQQAVHTQLTYHAEVDTTCLSPAACAAKLRTVWGQTQRPSKFR